jgi:NADPH:quinone reductase-like Zn-dependent oxidoreductase
VLKAGGKLVTIAADAEGTKDPKVRDAFFIVESNSGQLAELARLIDAGTLRVFVDRTFTLQDARAAYEHRTRRGKAVLVVE